jgi:SAM-dependent methyltransferase
MTPANEPPYAGVRIFVTKMVHKLASHHQERGLWFTIALVAKNLLYYLRLALDANFDRKYGVRTSGWAFLEQLEIDSPNKSEGIRYQPSSEMHLRRMFSCLPRSLNEFTFVDFGSGKGRALLAAADYAFKRIVGVEFSPALHAKSVDNIRKYSNPGRKCFDVCSVCMDAEDFAIPDGPCVFYFFDPFRGGVMKRVLANIAHAHRRSGSKMFIIFYAPMHCDFVEELGIFQRLVTPPLPFDPSLPMQYKFVLFETRDAVKSAQPT